MVTDSSLSSALVPESATPAAQQAEVNAIDASTRGPVLLLAAAATVWLLVAAVLGLIAAWKLHTPGFLDACPLLTYGRVSPAQTNAFIYGWGFNAAFGIALWLMARLAQAELRGAGFLAAAVLFWNVGVAVGVGGILAGDSTSLEALEMPFYAAPVLFVAYAGIAAWAFVALRAGRATTLYVSQWYLLLALLAFPWLYSTAQIMLVVAPVRGTLQAVVAAWFASNLFLLCLAPVALAAIYYLLPKILGRPIRSYSLSRLGFWWFVFFASWTGVARLIGGPVPAWLQSAGIVASFMLLVPMVIFGINHYGSLSGGGGAVKSSATLRFLTVAIVAFTLTLLVWAANALQGVASLTQFTLFQAAHSQLGLYGFFSMAMFGAWYYIVPRLTGVAWPSNSLSCLHFWTSVLGLALMVVALALGGIGQGREIADAGVPFVEIGRHLRPYLLTASVGAVLLLIGQLAFAVNLVWSLVRGCPICAACHCAQLEVAAR